ncbi:MAG: alpha/beta fold hydrolase, partial [Pseudomonadota bacterium]
MIFHDVSPIPAAISHQKREVSHHGLTLRYSLWGEITKPLILLQHGGKDHGRSWDWTVAALAQDYCLAVPDLRGHGDSDWVPGGGYEIFDFVADMAVIVEDLKQQGCGTPLAIIGHSLGGNIALHYTASQPAAISRLIVIEGLGFSQTAFDKVINVPIEERWKKAVDRRLGGFQRQPRSFKTIEEGVARMASLHPQLREDQARHLAFHALRQEGEGYRWKHDPLLTFQSLRPTPPSEYLGLYQTIPCPVLLMYGMDSWASSAKEDGLV